MGLFNSHGVKLHFWSIYLPDTEGSGTISSRKLSFREQVMVGGLMRKWIAFFCFLLVQLTLKHVQQVRGHERNDMGYTAQDR